MKTKLSKWGLVFNEGGHLFVLVINSVGYWWYIYLLGYRNYKLKEQGSLDSLEK